jgi:DNA-nicking Smr family endonuclease
VDVAHAGESWEEAQQKIVKAVDRALAGRHKGVKIVHGYGQSSGSAVIRGKAVELLSNLATRTGGRLRPDGNNPGAHILWLAD